MRVLMSAFIVFIIIFLVAVLFLSGMGERLLIRTADIHHGEAVLREVSVKEYRTNRVQHYTIELQGMDGAPSLNLSVTTGHRLYDLRLMHDILMKCNKNEKVNIEWCRTFASGEIVANINGVNVITTMDTPSFLIWLFMTVIGVIMLAFTLTVTVFTFKNQRA